MIYIELNKYELQREFEKSNRDFYSLDGYQAMIDLFDETDSDFELDVIALCCDFEEEDEEYIRGTYNIEEDKDLMEYLNYHTYAMVLNNGNIFYQNF